MKHALITGITGQDGSYLAELLLEKGYHVSGTTRGHASLENIAQIADRIEMLEGDLLDKSFIQELANRSFDELYNLASVSTVQNPWEDAVETLRITGFTPLLLLEAIRTASPTTRFFQASSA